MPENSVGEVFSMQICTPTYDVGWDGCLRLSALLRWQQEAGEQQLIRHNMAWETLAADGWAFVLTRAAGTIYRLPHSGERVRLETWQRRVLGASFLRGYRLIGGGEERLTECASTFCVVDAQTHQLLRARVLGERQLPSLEREGACPPPRRLHEPDVSFVPVGEWEVHRSAVDFNRHLNNTVYADLLTDFLPEEAAARPMRTFTLQLEHEARCGDRLALRRAATADESFVEGWRGDVRCFLGSVTF